MSINEAQMRIKARVWQSLAQSGLDVSPLDKSTLETFVDIVTEAALIEIDAEIGRSSEAQMAEQPAVKTATEAILNDHKEDVLWEGRPFLSISLHYTITDERIRITEGILGRARENVELVRIQDMDYSQTFSERMLNLGDINIRSHDPSHPQIVLKNVKDPEGVYEILRRAVLNARSKHNFTYREEM